MKHTPAEIGSHIKEARKAAKLSQLQLATLLGKTSRTIQKYESGEIEPSLAMINELAKLLNTTPTFLIGYSQESIHLDSMADFCAFFFQLEQKAGVSFDISVEKPKEAGKWRCSITFDGQEQNADYNADICLFLEEYQAFREKRQTYWISQDAYADWQNKHLTYAAPTALSDREPEEIDEMTRIKLRDQLIEEQLRQGKPSDPDE